MSITGSIYTAQRTAYLTLTPSTTTHSPHAHLSLTVVVQPRTGTVPNLPHGLHAEAEAEVDEHPSPRWRIARRYRRRCTVLSLPHYCTCSATLLCPKKQVTLTFIPILPISILHSRPTPLRCRPSTERRAARKSLQRGQQLCLQ